MLRHIAPSVLALGIALPLSAHGDEKHPAGDEHPAHHDEKPAPTPEHDAHEHGAHAHGDHAHASPHGGVVATVDKDTHVEVLFTEKDVSVWFYDADMKPVALPADAKASVVVGKFGKKVDLPIAKKADGTPDDHLLAELDLPKDVKVAMVIQATVAGKARTARVERAPSTPAPSAPPAAAKGTP